jgi:hypothetical protein
MGTYQQVLFHVVFGALHVDLVFGRKFIADSIKRRRTGFDIPGQLESKDSIEFPALRALPNLFIHG